MGCQDACYHHRDCDTTGRAGRLSGLAAPLVVERTIAWVNRCRRLSKDVEHLAKNSAAWIYWASIQRMVRYLAPPQDQERPYTRKKATWYSVYPWWIIPRRAPGRL